MKKILMISCAIFLLIKMSNCHNVNIKLKPLNLKSKPQDNSCNTADRISDEYNLCISELSALKNEKHLLIEDNSELVNNLKMKINVLVETNSDLQSDFDAEMKILNKNYQNLMAKKNSLKIKYSQLKIHIKDMINSNKKLKSEADFFSTRNEKIRANLIIFEKTNRSLKMNCGRDHKNSNIIIGSSGRTRSPFE